MKSIFDHSLSLSLSLSEMDGNSFISRDTCGHSCSVTGAIWRPDGRYFDGDDDLINCSDNGALNFTTGEFTLEAWINAASLAANSEILCRGQHGIDGYYLRIPSNGRVYFCARCDTGTKAIYTPVNTITIAAWYHIIVVVRPLSTGLVLVNGDVVELDCNETLGTIASNSRDFKVGINDDGNNDYCGLIGEVRVYRRALATPEAQHNYLATKWRYR